MNNFSLLQNCIDSSSLNVKTTDFDHPLYKRIISSFINDFSDKSSLDVAILLRQILLKESATRKSNDLASLQIPNTSIWPTENEWDKVGIEFTKSDKYFNIYAQWWKPNWLESSEIQPVDYNAVSEINVRDNVHFKNNDTDIFLKSLNQKEISNYRSNDQQRAVRSALSLYSGETLAISLPTGEGKSLIFQLVNLIGFPETNNNGLTLVVVPTVTLALDQEKNMQNLLGNDDPYAFVSTRDNENNTLKDKIKNGSQSICFISPEAAYGPLQNSLIQSAQNGLLKAIIVDEAHIIEEWGTDFRAEFQLFAGLWRQLLNISPDTNKFRTIMLSATYTQSAIDTIKTLYSYKNNSFKMFNATKLRSEIDYWIANKVDENNRKKRVLESILHLPRPLILYTTEVKEANKYFSLIKENGFKSVAIVTGQSTLDERDNAIDKWKNGTLDLVVATSAFGLGIDYKHTRSVVHACIPETLNRFYQEVGRGGRDGKSSISLLIPTFEDKDLAFRMNSTKIIGNEKGFERWERLFQNKKQLNEISDKYIIDLYTSPKQGNDFQKKGIKDWNINVLLLMAKAQLIQLNGVPKNQDFIKDDFDRYIIIKILNEQHMDKTTWHKTTDKVRDSIYKSNKESLNLFLNFMNQKECPADIIAKLYQITIDSKEYDISKLCSSCILCRNGNKVHTLSPSKKAYPLTINQNNIEYYLGFSSIMVEYTLDDLKRIERSYARKFIKTIKNLMANKIQNYIFTKESMELFMPNRVKEKINGIPIFFETINKLSEIIVKVRNYPTNGIVFFFDPNIKITKEINHILSKENNIIFILKDTYDPVSNQRKLSDVYKYEIMNIEEFINKVSQ